MKLTNREINVLANDLTNKINEKNKAKKAVIAKNFKAVTLTNKEKEKALKTALVYKTQVELNKAYSKGGAANHVYSSSIANKIILASIDAQDLETLTASILKSYK